MKRIVLGIDGLSHQMVEKNQEVMPNLFKHFRADSTGVLKTTFPYFTGPAWTSFQTGKDTANHGVNNYFKYDDKFNIRLVNGNDIKEKTFYEVMDEHNLKCFIMNLPYTDPARIKGDIVFSWLFDTNDQDKLFQPKSLKDRFPSLQGYINDTDRSKGTMRYLESTYEALCSEEKIIREVLRTGEHDFYFFLITALDRVQHKTYHELMANEENKRTKLSKTILRKLDDIIAWIDGNREKDSQVVILSDHGFRAYEGKFYVNSWLKNNKYLKISANGVEIQEVINKGKQGKKRVNVSRFVSLVKRHPWLFKLSEPFYDIVLRRLPFDIVKKPKIDLTTSLAYCRSSFESTIFLTNHLSGPERQRIKTKLIKQLNQLKGIDAFDGQEFYKGKLSPQLGDIVVTSETLEIDSTIGDKEFIKMRRLMHDLYGTLICYGKGIKKNHTIPNPHIIDVAPTLLHLCGLPVPADMDGKVLVDMINNNAIPVVQERVVVFGKQEKEKQRIREALGSIRI